MNKIRHNTSTNIYQPDKSSLTSQSDSINSNFVSVLIETQIEIKIRISKKRKMTFKFIFEKLRNEKMQFLFFKKLIFWIILSIHGFPVNQCMESIIQKNNFLKNENYIFLFVKFWNMDVKFIFLFFWNTNFNFNLYFN